jgi:integrase
VAYVKRGKVWYFTIEGKNENGKRTQDWINSHATTKTECKEIEARTKVAIQDGTWSKPSKLLFREFLNDEYLPTLRRTRRPNTVHSYEGVIRRYISPSLAEGGLGDIRLRGLRAAHLLRFYNSMSEGGLDRSAQYAHSIIHAALKLAWRLGHVPRNEADLVDKPTVIKNEGSVWSPSQTEKFFDSASIRHHRLYTPFLVAGLNGVRKSEVLGLTWPHVHLDEGYIRIEKTLVTAGYDVIVGEPKSEKSRRNIALDSYSLASLKEWKARQAEERMRYRDVWQPGDWVFTHEPPKEGEPMPDNPELRPGAYIHPDRFGKVWTSLVKKSGLPVIGLHRIRHGYITMGESAGVALGTMSKRVGHSSVVITGDVYTHRVDEDDRKAAQAIADLIFGKRITSTSVSKPLANESDEGDEGDGEPATA